MNDEDIFLAIWAFCLTVVMPIVITKLVLDYRLKKGAEPAKLTQSPYFEPKPKQEPLSLPEDSSLKISELEKIIQQAVAQSVTPLHQELNVLRTQIQSLDKTPSPPNSDLDTTKNA